MEALGWLLALSAIAEVLFKRVVGKQQIALGLGVGCAADVAAWLLWVVAILGVVINSRDDADAVYIIGNFRWVILLYGYSYLLRGYGLGGRAAQKFATEPTGFLRVLLPALVLVSFYGIVQVFTGLDLIRPGREVHNLQLAGVNVFRASGFFNNPMTFAHLFILWFCLLAAYLIVGGGTKARRVWVSVGVAVVGLSILLSLIRGVWISGVAAALSMLWLWRRRAFWLGLAATAVAVLIMVATVPPLRDRLTSIFATDNVYNRDRVVLWEANWEIFKTYPWFGIGYTENERRIGEFYQQMGVENGFKGHAHNVYLQFLSGTGLLGLLCYLIMMGSFLWASVRVWRAIPAAGVAAGPATAAGTGTRAAAGTLQSVATPWTRALVLGTFGAQVSLHVGGLTQNNFSDGEVTHNLMLILALVAYWAGATGPERLSRSTTGPELYVKASSTSDAVKTTG